jgi:SAM-dependent methyltransferase
MRMLPRVPAKLRPAVDARADDLLRRLPAGRTLRLALAGNALQSFAAARRSPAIRVLDAGCEQGLLALELSRRNPGWFVVATDLAPAPLAEGRLWARTERLPVSFVQMDLTDFVGNGVYDVVATVESLVEIPDDQAALANLIEAVAPGGLLYVQVPVADWTPVLPGSERSWRREARHGYDVDDLQRTLVAAGLRVISVRPTFHRLTALCEDVRNRLRHRRRAVRLLLLPLSLAAVRLERAGLRLGKPRAVIVMAIKPESQLTVRG